MLNIFDMVIILDMVIAFTFWYFLFVAIRKIFVHLFCKTKEEKYRIVMQARMVMYVGAFMETNDQNFAQAKADKINYRIAKKSGNENYSMK